MLKNWAFSDCGFDRMRASSVLGGGSWRSQLVPTPPMHQLTLLNRPVNLIMLRLHISYVQLGGGIGLPGHFLAPNEGSYSSHFANKVEKAKVSWKYSSRLG